MDKMNYPTRGEAMMKACRDSAVHTALGSHADEIRDNRAVVARVADLAAHLALEQFSTMVRMELARIDAEERSRVEMAMLRPSRITLGMFGG